MSGPLLRLTYWSRSRVAASAEEMQRAVAGILAVSRRNNAADDVSGALMFNQGCFAQILEGPAEAIERTFERIQCDDRHSDVIVLELAPVEERAFPAWSMAHVGHSLRDRDLFSHIAETTDFDARRIEATEIFRLLRDLAVEEGCPA